jgi:hypothetical protein
VACNVLAAMSSCWYSCRAQHIAVSYTAVIQLLVQLQGSTYCCVVCSSYTAVGTAAGLNLLLCRMKQSYSSWYSCRTQLIDVSYAAVIQLVVKLQGSTYCCVIWNSYTAVGTAAGLNLLLCRMQQSYRVIVSLYAPDDYSTKNTQKYFKQFHSPW